LTPKTICEGLCGPVHVNALFGHVNALFGGCRVPVEFPLSCRVVEARAQCMVYLLLQICLLRRSAVERASDPTSSVENPIVLRLVTDSTLRL
jgi:hypothetical protein